MAKARKAQKEQEKEKDKRAQAQAQQFQELLGHYEARRLARANKLADDMLAVDNPNPEVRCLKGILLIHAGKRSDGAIMVAEALKSDPSSGLMWHLYALMKKGQHNLQDTLTAYRMAMHQGQSSLNILREMSIIHTQLRQYDDLVGTRLQLLQSARYVRGHWTALAIAYKLNGNLKAAHLVLDSMDNFMRAVPDHDPDYGELILFHIRVLEEKGDLQEALSLLESKVKKQQLVARPVVFEYQARLLSKLKSMDAETSQSNPWTADAEKAWCTLIEHNWDCYEYYKGFLANRGIDFEKLTHETQSKTLEILDKFSTQFAKANAPRRLALTVAEGEPFRGLAMNYIEAALRKGIPSLFSDVKSLYSDPFKRQIIGNVVEEIRSTSKSSDPYYLWTLYFLAQHYSFLGQQHESLNILEEALGLSPALVELHMTKARVLKRAGDPYGAIQAMDKARQLEGQDRYINTKSGKYRLRAGMVQEAENVLGLFTKKGAVPGADLLEMQALYYLKEAGDAQRRNGTFNLALKHYYAIRNVFKHFYNDQYDFHQYAIRKTNLNSYLDLIRWGDILKSHPAYICATVSAAQVWVTLSDDPSIGKALQPPVPTEPVKPEPAEANPPDPKKHKEDNKARKAAHKSAGSSQKDGGHSSKGNVPEKETDLGLEVPDEDEDYLKLVVADDVLERAADALQTLEDVRDNIDVNLVVFDVAIRRKKYFQAARALRRINAVDPQHPELHLRVVQFCKAITSLDESTSAIQRLILEEVLAVLKPAGLSLENFNSQYFQLHCASAKAILACAKVLRVLECSRDEVEDLLFTALNTSVKLHIEDACAILSYLREFKSPRAEEFRIACDNKYKHSTVFKSDEEQAVLRQECLQ